MMLVAIDPEPSSSGQLIEGVARRLTEIRQSRDAYADQKSWEMARTYVAEYERISSAWEDEEGYKPNPHEVNRRIRAVSEYDGPGGSWLSHAKRTADVFHDLFVVAGNNEFVAPYEYYRHIANCSAPNPTKVELRDWVEQERPSRTALRDRIKALVAGIPRPDFELKTTNFWKFSDKINASEFDGGIHPELVANLIYYCTDPGDTILDPMAGGDTASKVLRQYRFFQEVDPALMYSGPRSLIRADIAPTDPGILRCDVRQIGSTVEPGSVDFCILDPPYWRIAEDKYDHFGSTIEEWRENISLALGSISATLAPGGLVAVIVDDFLRAREHHPLALYIAMMAEERGYRPHSTIYNHYPHAIVSMGPIQMHRCKKSRLLVNGCKVIQIMERP